jgi:L-alanine-DL-glutamate epimerase-like enolase superfamily enzyme
VNRLDPPLRVSGLTIGSPSIVRLRLEFPDATGRGYAWTLDHADALDLERRLRARLEQCVGSPLDNTLVEWLADIGPDPDLSEQRTRAAIDMALTDGFSPLREPNCLDGIRRPRIYASDLYDSQPLEEIVSLAARYVDAGYPGLKMRLGRRDADWARARLHAIRAAIGPNTTLMVDAVQGWDPDFCRDFMPDLVRADVRWLEDPFTPADVDLYRDLADWSPISICTGESCRSLEHVQRVIGTGVPIVMLDIQHLGGIGPSRRAMDMVQNAQRQLTFHVFTDISAGLAGPDVEWLEWAPLWGDCLQPPRLSDVPGG